MQGTGWQAGQGGFLVVPGSYAVDLGLEASSGLSTSGTLRVSD